MSDRKRRLEEFNRKGKNPKYPTDPRLRAWLSGGKSAPSQQETGNPDSDDSQEDTASDAHAPSRTRGGTQARGRDASDSQGDRGAGESGPSGAPGAGDSSDDTRLRGGLHHPVSEEERKKIVHRLWLFVAGGVALVVLAFVLFAPSGFTSVKTSEGMQIVQSQAIDRIQVTDGSRVVNVWLESPYTPTDMEGKPGNPTKKVTFQFLDAQAEDVATAIETARSVNGYNAIVPQQSFLMSIVSFLAPMLLVVGLFIWLFPRIQQGMGQFGKIKKDGMDADRPTVTFKDVAGVDEAVEELAEIKEFIATPEKFHSMGVKIPKGVLLYGPPGTGKTLLARAVAGEAGVPFFHISASEFVEMFVGVGASRVRDLFSKAKKVAPAIIFVDEIDAVGRNRGAGIGGGNDEREQTLNQLLVEMDGFDERTNVIVIAATNRPDVLDSALLRPGRFDRQVSVENPDLPGRVAILKVHVKGKPLDPAISLESIARRTPGFSGADLANLLNEAALLAARRNKKQVEETDVDEAIDRLIAGPQKRTRVMNPKDKRMTAYHEGGHAVTAAALNHSDPVTKVTILPRGRALGYTMVMPTEDKYSVSRRELLDQLVYCLGGRAAEEIVFHDPSTGASNDIQKATDIAHKMVTEYGMSSRIGAVRLVDEESDPMTRMAGGQGRQHSEQTAYAVDEEVHALLETAAQEAWQIIMDNRHVLDRLAEALLDKETVLEGELKEIFRDIVKAPPRDQWLSAPTRPVSDVPPVDLPEPTPTGVTQADGAEQIAGADADAQKANRAEDTSGENRLVDLREQGEEHDDDTAGTD